ncbi:MAG TPA: hypothetical protein VF026_23650 [Ktedonobacteraceae bacterium]
MMGGDACVALVLLRQRLTPPTMGDASVPTRHIRHSRPYGYEGASEATPPPTSL